MPAVHGAQSRERAAVWTAAALCLAAAACASGGGGPAPSDAVEGGGWAALATPRPAALEGAAAVALGDFAFLPLAPFEVGADLTPEVALMELAAADLLRRRDVRLVERRRFAAAAEREQRGQPPLPGQPPAGRSRQADYVLAGSWARTGDGGALDVRLVDPATGLVAKAWRTGTPASPDPAGLARALSAGLVEGLRSLDRLPEWADPLQPGAGPAAYAPSGVPSAAVAAFFEGAAAEDRFDWNGARAAYERALDAAGGTFPEARAALARAARLRQGGTLAESE